MKMKRAVKAAIAASMAIAVFGVGAVSFAAWTGSAVPDLSVSGTLGTGLEVAEEGFDSAGLTNWNAGENSGKGFMNGLVPYDQPDNTLPVDGSCQKIATETLPAITLGSWQQSDACILMEVENDGLPEGTDRTDGTFYFMLYDANQETPRVPTVGLDELEDAGWKLIGGEDSYLPLTGLGTLSEGVLSNVGIAVIYVSDSIAQEGKGFSFTISLYNPNAAN